MAGCAADGSQITGTAETPIPRASTVVPPKTPEKMTLRNVELSKDQRRAVEAIIRLRMKDPEG